MLKFVVLALCGIVVLTATERAVRAGRRRLRLIEVRDDLETDAARRRRTLTILVYVVGICGLVFAGSLPLFPLLAGERPPWHPLCKTLDLVQGAAIAGFVIVGIVMGHKIKAIDAEVGNPRNDAD